MRFLAARFQWIKDEGDRISRNMTGFGEGEGPGRPLHTSGPDRVFQLGCVASIHRGIPSFDDRPCLFVTERLQQHKGPKWHHPKHGVPFPPRLWNPRAQEYQWCWPVGPFSKVRTSIPASARESGEAFADRHVKEKYHRKEGYLVIFPLAVCGSGLDSNTLFTLQFHAVHLSANSIFTSDL